MKTLIRFLAVGLLCCIGLRQGAGQVPVLDWAMVYDNSKDTYQTGDKVGGMVCDGEGNTFQVGLDTKEGSENVCTLAPNPGTGWFPALICTPRRIESSAIVVSKTGPSGEVVWVKKYGSQIGWYNGASIGLDQAGNIYVTANVAFQYTNPSIGYGAGPSTRYNGPTLILVWKLDTNGGTEWSRTIITTGISRVSTALLSNGSAYFMGHFRDTLNIFGEGYSSQLISAGQRDLFLMKVNPSGVPQWVKHFPSSFDEGISSIQIDQQSNLYITGFFYDTFTIPATNGSMRLVSAGDADIFVIKLNSAGNCIWARSIGGPIRDSGMANIDRYNNLYITGAFMGEVDFDPGPGTFVLTTPEWRTDAFALKLDHDGHFVWAKKSSENSQGSAVAVCPDGSVYVATTNSAGAQVTKYDPHSNWLWTGSISGRCSISSLAVGEEEKVLLYGAFSGKVDLNPGRRESIRLSGGFSDIFIAQWRECHPSAGSTSLVVCDTFIEHGYLFTESGLYTLNIVNTSGCDSTLTLDLTVIKVDTSVTQTDSTLVANAADAAYRWLDCNNNNRPIPGETSRTFRPKVHGHYAVEVTYKGCTHVSSCYFARGAVISLFPNPTTGQFTIDMGGDYYNLTLVVTTPAGQEVYTRRYNTARIIPLELPGAAGVYVVRIQDGENLHVLKVVKQ